MPIPLIIFICLLGVIGLAIFTFVLVLIFSPKARAKLISHQAKSIIAAHKTIIDEHQNDLKEIALAHAKIQKDATKTKASAVAEGLKAGLNEEATTIYCKHCGSSISDDSIFCKFCGVKQE